MKDVGSRPEFPNSWARRSKLLRPVAAVEYACRWFFYLMKVSALLRLTVEGGAAVAVLAGLWGFYLELEQRKIDRSVRVASLFAQIAQTHALPDGRGMGSLKPSVQVLARDGVSMKRINLQGADLSGLDLSGVDLESANLQEVNLSQAILSNANLMSANLLRANLSSAILSKADLRGANIESANLEKAMLDYADLSPRYEVTGKPTAKVLKLDIDKTKLDGARLSQADLTNATLQFATFTKADLELSVLDSADVSGADFSGATGLKQAQVDEACLTPLEFLSNGLPQNSTGLSVTWNNRSC